MPARGAADGFAGGDDGGPGSSATGPYLQPDYAEIHGELSRKGMTLMLLWHEYQANNPRGSNLPIFSVLRSLPTLGRLAIPILSDDCVTRAK